MHDNIESNVLICQARGASKGIALCSHLKVMAFVTNTFIIELLSRARMAHESVASSAMVPSIKGSKCLPTDETKQGSLVVHPLVSSKTISATITFPTDAKHVPHEQSLIKFRIPGNVRHYVCSAC